MKYAILFQGQGNYNTSLNRSIYENSKEIQQMFKVAEEVTELPLKELLFTVPNLGVLNTGLAQPLVFLMEYSKYRHYCDKMKDKPTAFLGHSLGEITALTAAGAITFEDALTIVKERGRLMNSILSSNQGMMAIIGADSEYVDEICKQVSNQTKLIVVSANYNSPTQVCISGDKRALELVSKRLEKYSVKYLATKGAFHSPIMQQLETPFKRFLEQFNYKPLQTPVISCKTAKPYIASWNIPYVLSEHLYSPVRWHSSIEYLVRNGILTFLENSSSGLFKNFDLHLGTTLTWHNYETINQTLNYDFDKLYNQSNNKLGCSALLIGECLYQMTAHQWERNISEKYITEAKQIYENVMKLYIEAFDKELEPSKDQINFALDSLEKVLSFKKVEQSKVTDIQKSILDKYGIGKVKVY